MVFSSSATVYGQPEKIPCVEDFQLMAMNPYGRTKVCSFGLTYLSFLCWYNFVFCMLNMASIS